MKTTKRSLIFSSCLAIVLCVCLISGATFALFTSESKVNVAVTSGKVEVVASIAVTDVYSPTAINADGRITDETNAADFETATFANGGTCAIEGNVLMVTNLTPGDKVSFTINVQNNGNVATVYRYGYTVVAAEGEEHTVAEAYKLYSGMNFVFGTAVTENAAAYRTAWAVLGETVTVDGSLELPTTATSELSSLSAAIVFTVEAAQGNLDISDSVAESTPIVSESSQVTDLLESASENQTISIATSSPVGISNIGTNGLTLTGVSPEDTRITTSANKITGNDVTISNVTVEGGGANGTTGCLNISGNNTTVDNVNFIGENSGNDINITVSTGTSNEGTTFKNSTIKNGFRGIQFWKLSGNSVIDNCVIDDNVYTFNIDSVAPGATLSVINSTLNGWTSYTKGITLVSFTNCRLGKGAGYAYLRPYSETKLEGCEFTAADYELNAGGTEAFTITLTNCTKNGVAITADNVLTLLVDTDSWNTNATLIVNGTVVPVTPA